MHINEMTDTMNKTCQHREQREQADKNKSVLEKESKRSNNSYHYYYYYIIFFAQGTKS